MRRSTQSDLQRNVEIFLANGRDPQAQTVLARVGYGHEALDHGQALLGAWLRSQMQVQLLLAEQKEATQAEHETRQAARQAATSFSDTVRILFGHDNILLTKLGLNRRTGSAGSAKAGAGNGAKSDEAETPPARSKPGASAKAALMIAHWRMLFNNAQSLPQAQLDQLAQAGWPGERLEAALGLVEAFAAADTLQQQKIMAYRTELEGAKVAEQELREWYRRAQRLVQRGLKDNGGQSQPALAGLLGL